MCQLIYGIEMLKKRVLAAKTSIFKMGFFCLLSICTVVGAVLSRIPQHKPLGVFPSKMVSDLPRSFMVKISQNA